MTNFEHLHEDFLNKNNIDKIMKFQCGDEKQVERFLKEEAVILMERNLVRTRLFFDENQNMIGFYSLFNDNIKMNKNKRQELEVKLPSNVSVIPAIRLHYLGVDERYRHHGYGKFLMASVLYYSSKVAEISGCPLITVESTRNARGFYEKFDFTYISPKGDYDFMAFPTRSLFEISN